jgi:ABC-type nitrate/sulfonate/bicarbonate transport system ATPase subunit
MDGAALSVTNIAGKIGFVFQRPLLLPWRTALENVALTLEVVRPEMSRADRLTEAERWLTLTGLPDSRIAYLMSYPEECSKGFRFLARLLFDHLFF